jgi:hypothetical protein
MDSVVRESNTEEELKLWIYVCNQDIRAKDQPRIYYRRIEADSDMDN